MKQTQRTFMVICTYPTKRFAVDIDLQSHNVTENMHAPDKCLLYLREALHISEQMKQSGQTLVADGWPKVSISQVKFFTISED